MLSDITNRALFPDEPADLSRKDSELRSRIRELDDGAEESEMSVDLLSIDDLLSEPVVSVDLEQYYLVYAALLGIEVPKEPPSADQLTGGIGITEKCADADLLDYRGRWSFRRFDVLGSRLVCEHPSGKLNSGNQNESDRSSCLRIGRVMSFHLDHSQKVKPVIAQSVFSKVEGQGGK